MFNIFTTDNFEEEFNKLDNSEKLRVEGIINQLKEQGQFVGKPLGGLKFFREKKLNGKRIYYLFYKNLNLILLVAISNKKTQQITINQILLKLKEYEEYVQNIKNNI